MSTMTLIRVISSFLVVKELRQQIMTKSATVQLRRKSKVARVFSRSSLSLPWAWSEEFLPSSVRIAKAARIKDHPSLEVAAKLVRWRSFKFQGFRNRKVDKLLCRWLIVVSPSSQRPRWYLAPRTASLKTSSTGSDKPSSLKLRCRNQSIKLAYLCKSAKFGHRLPLHSSDSLRVN